MRTQDQGVAANAGRCRNGRCCGECDQPDRRFYVTVVDGPRSGLMAGPFETHQEALDRVDAANRVAQEADARAFWYAYGTCLMERPAEGWPDAPERIAAAVEAEYQRVVGPRALGAVA